MYKNLYVILIESTCLYYVMSLDQKLSVPNLHTFPTREIVDALKIDKARLYEPESILDSLEQLQRYIPLKSEIVRKQDEIRKLVDGWFTYKVGTAYEQLSPEIFKMERTIEVDPAKHEVVNPGENYRAREGTLVSIKIPLFLQASIHDERWRYEFQHDDNYNSRRYQYRISADVPRVPKAIRDIGKRALATPYDVYSEAIETRVLSDLLLENPSLAPSPADSKLLILWKPRAEDLKIKAERIDKDPILVLKWNRPYLVSLWTEPNEEPFAADLPAFRLARKRASEASLEGMLGISGDEK